ncbi:ANTAR domain-containing protein [Nocardioides terrae]|uniref:ANTAR domain-containing protein n=1 Tax=Nocardioides terrae TaxID=574651 RepID=A0A1I1KJW7_9ACTN|nr:ANTAR domain-containing protein [Nocardioides terrae]SFC57730.1 ANTAR domain-containing protein [Nocardioides terrae]
MDDNTDKALDAIGRLAESLSPGDLDRTIASLTTAAVEILPGVDHASITIRHSDGAIRSYAMTDPVLRELDDYQFSMKEGPCYDGVTSDAFTVCGDLLADSRYPGYGRLAWDAGIKSQAGLRLFESPTSIGGLNLYSTSVGALADITFLAGLFASHARTALTYAAQIDQLGEAMLSRQKIGQAVGVIMERYQLPEERAFGYLSRLSQDRNIKVREIAEEIIGGTDPVRSMQ